MKHLLLSVSARRQSLRDILSRDTRPSLRWAIVGYHCSRNNRCASRNHVHKGSSPAGRCRHVPSGRQSSRLIVQRCPSQGWTASPGNNILGSPQV